MPDKRQLQAIMFTDVYGYSARMGADEENTVRVVREHREIVRALLARHGGREVDTIGDVIFGEDGQLSGEAVNIAARVDLLTPPGGACVTASVHAQVHRNVREPFESLGVVPLKNIERAPPL